MSLLVHLLVFQQQQQLILAWLLVSCSAFAFAAAQLALPGCQDSCGNITVPYPFGTTQNCYLDRQYLMTCSTTYDPPKLFLMNGNIEVTNISLISGELWVLSESSRHCYEDNTYDFNDWVQLNRFFISNTKNKFTAVGCHTIALIADLDSDGGKKYATGCLSLCDNIDSVTNGSCTGIGCCQTTIPRGVRSFNITVESYVNNSNISNYNPCGHAFVSEENAYDFSSLNLSDFNQMHQFPVVIDWTVGNESCHEAQKNQTSYACKNNSYCSDYDSNSPRNGYRCFCSDGYEGNPYLPSGCTDIDECKVLSPCNMTCLNLPGKFNCSCPPGYQGNGFKNETGCSPIPIPDKRSRLVLWVQVALGRTCRAKAKEVY